MAFLIDKVTLNLDVPPLANLEKVNQVQAILNHLPDMVRAEIARVSDLLIDEYGVMEIGTELAPLNLPSVDIEHLLTQPYQFAQLIAISVFKQVYGAKVKADIWNRLSMYSNASSLVAPYVRTDDLNPDIHQISPEKQLYSCLMTGLDVSDKRLSDMINQMTGQLLMAMQNNMSWQGLLSESMGSDSQSFSTTKLISTSLLGSQCRLSSNTYSVKHQLPILLNNPLFFNRFVTLLLNSTDKKKVAHLLWYLLFDRLISAKNEAILQSQVSQRKSLEQTLVYILTLSKSAFIKKEKRLISLLTLDRVDSINQSNGVILKHIFLNTKESHLVDAAFTWLSVAQIQLPSTQGETSLLSLLKGDKGALLVASEEVVSSSQKSVLVEPVKAQEESKLDITFYRESVLSQLFAWQKIDQYVSQLMVSTLSHSDWLVVLNALEHHLYEAPFNIALQSAVSHLMYEVRLLRQQLQYSVEALPSHERWLRLKALMQRQKAKLVRHYDRVSFDEKTDEGLDSQTLFSLGSLVRELLSLYEEESVSLPTTLMQAIESILGGIFEDMRQVALNDCGQDRNQTHDTLSSITSSNLTNNGFDKNDLENQNADLSPYDRSNILLESSDNDELLELLLLLETELNQQVNHAVSMKNANMIRLVSTLLLRLEAKGSEDSYLDAIDVIRHCALVVAVMPVVHQSPIVKAIKKWLDETDENRINIDDCARLKISLRTLFSSFLSSLTATDKASSASSNMFSTPEQLSDIPSAQDTAYDLLALNEGEMFNLAQEMPISVNSNDKFEYQNNLNLLFDDNPIVVHKALAALTTQLSQHFLVLAQTVNAENLAQQYLGFYSVADRLQAMYEQVILWLELEQSLNSQHQNSHTRDLFISLLNAWIEVYLQVREATLGSHKLEKDYRADSIGIRESARIKVPESIDVTLHPFTKQQVTDIFNDRRGGGLLHHVLNIKAENAIVGMKEQIKEQVELIQSISQVLPLTSSKLQIENTLKELSESVIMDDQYSYDAGLLILWPFLSTLFERLDLLQDDFSEESKKRKIFISDRAQAKAYSLLLFLCGSDKESGYYGVINLLVGYEFDAIVTMPVPLNAKEEKEALSLLELVIARWEVLKKMPYSSFQSLFLQRKCLISLTEMGVMVTVEKQTLDILMQKMPWGLGLIQLPWLDKDTCISVEWPY